MELFRKQKFVFKDLITGWSKALLPQHTVGYISPNEPFSGSKAERVTVGLNSNIHS